jgi:hypothetical protein
MNQKLERRYQNLYNLFSKDKEQYDKELDKLTDELTSYYVNKKGLNKEDALLKAMDNVSKGLLEYSQKKHRNKNLFRTFVIFLIMLIAYIFRDYMS